MTSRPTNKYLEFQEWKPAHRKTLVVAVRSAEELDVLGRIKWYGAWRQYAFFPEPETIWNPGCLETVNAYIAALMAERSSGRL